MKQVQNIAAILKAYPKVNIKIGGYTDKTGDTQLTGAEGYGSQFAKAAVDAPDEDRKKDRRISVNVRNK